MCWINGAGRGGPGRAGPDVDGVVADRDHADLQRTLLAWPAATRYREAAIIGDVTSLLKQPMVGLLFALLTLL